jgi:hypothetical protein
LKWPQTCLAIDAATPEWEPGNTPAGMRLVLSDIAAALFKRGWMLRSGGSMGADLAFEQGAEDRKEIFFPKDATVEAHLIAQRYCPDWNRRTPFAKNLLARKSMILLGEKLDSPVSALICWTADGQPSGGTGQAIRVAAGYGIPVYNLFDSAQGRAV